nr:retrovirus-related Pol polyprotein from transposon TNT 1-94 [Tanacetum cinerariifolium]
PFQMGTFRETLTDGNEGALHLGPERARVYYDLSPEDKKSVKMLLEGSELTKEDRESQLYDDFENFHQNKGETIHDYYGWQNKGQGNNARGTGAAGNREAHNRVGNVNPGQARHIKCYNYNGIGHIVRNCTQPKRPQNSKYFKNKTLLMQAQENRVVLDEEQLLFLAGGQDNTVDEDVDELPVKDLALNCTDYVPDILKIKAKALKEQTKAAKPITALTAYSPNKPTTLVPRCFQQRVK